MAMVSKTSPIRQPYNAPTLEDDHQAQNFRTAREAVQVSAEDWLIERVDNIGNPVTPFQSGVLPALSSLPSRRPFLPPQAKTWLRAATFRSQGWLRQARRMSNKKLRLPLFGGIIFVICFFLCVSKAFYPYSTRLSLQSL
jgi:hypothetical protein